MRVVHITKFGGPEVLEPGERPDPVAGPGQVVVDVAAAEVLFLDTQLRSGWGEEFFGIRPPFVPGAGVAGPVRSVGPDVDPGWIGRRVVAGTGATGEYLGGGYAERAVVPVGEVFELPDGLDFAEGLAAPHDGLTALSRLEKAAIQPGERVLVNAAGGSLGAWLVPLARAADGFVIAAARGDRKLEQARQWGADVTVDYSEPGWTDAVRSAAGTGLDVVFDGAGGQLGRDAFELTARGGRFFSYGAASGDFAAIDPAEPERRGITVVGIGDSVRPEDRRRLSERALAELASGRVRPVIGRSFPLDRAADAHAAMAAREVIGKTVLLP